MKSIVLICCSLALTAAQSVLQTTVPPNVSPSNASLPAAESVFTQINLQGVTGQSSFFNIAPLTSEVGEGQGAAAISSIHFSGNLIAVGPANENNVTASEIAYISCDDDSATSNIDPTSVVTTVGQVLPKAILLYSLYSASCNLTGPFPSTTLYSMVAATDSRNLLNSIKTGSIEVKATIASNTTTGSGSDPTGGPAPTTAVAMSILYSITGLITLLFLIIIATGAIRAHRHPERYGPRTGISGRPRQSRAKGLARAMLETLPIVKFGDPEPAKPENRDIELEDGTSLNQTERIEPVAVTTTEEVEVTTNDPNAESGSAHEKATINSEVATKEEEHLGCSICTEDFTTGEDVRVLPCNHKYHPACIDPWLLNVSGTCPLCRHDLRPVASSDDPTSTTEEGTELPPPLETTSEHDGSTEESAGAVNTHSHRVSRFLDRNILRHAPAHERIAALRRLREESQQAGQTDAEAVNADGEGEQSRAVRFTGRLRGALRL